MIGELMGKSLAVQKLVGVHLLGIRAVEFILKKPGLRFDKVVILCGGPDWPTSVLTGILKLNVFQMMLGTLPVLVLITPCVLAGACLLMPELSALSPAITMLAIIAQGGAMVMALLFIALVAAREAEHLMVWRPEHEAVMKYAALEASKAKYRELAISFTNMGLVH